MRRTLFFLLLIFSENCGAEPVLPEPIRQSIDAAMQAGAYRDVAAGWIEGEQRATAFFGQAGAESAFEIGAASEIFTELLLAQAAYEGKLRLQSTLKELLPDLTFADPLLGATTLEALATHRSGLPALPPNLMPRDVADPYAAYGEPELRAFLGNYHLSAPASDYAYSVLDSGVLGYVLAHRYTGAFEQVLQERILAPLGMKHAGFGDEHLIDGHSRGEGAPHWHFGVLAGSAGMRATLNELLDFLQANLRPEKSPLRAALLLARQARAHTPAGDIGLGWNILDAKSDGQTWPLLWRASTTAGFSTFIGFRTDRQRALVLLSNTDADLSALGVAALDERDLPVAQRRRSEAPAEPTRREDYVGLYQLRGGVGFVIRDHGGALFAQRQGDPAARLVALGDDMFDAGAEGYTVTFQREAGQVTSLIVAHGGINLLAQRLSTRAPRVARTALATAQQQLGEFIGDYRIASNSIARVAVADGLTLQLTGRAPQRLVAFATDRFACADESCELTFARDETGTVARVSVDFAGVQHDAPRMHWVVP